MSTELPSVRRHAVHGLKRFAQFNPEQVHISAVTPGATLKILVDCPNEALERFSSLRDASSGLGFCRVREANSQNPVLYPARFLRLR
jgi:hypothetical protein